MNTEGLRDKMDLQWERSHQKKKNQTQRSFLILFHYYYGRSLKLPLRTVYAPPHVDAAASVRPAAGRLAGRRSSERLWAGGLHRGQRGGQHADRVQRDRGPRRRPVVQLQRAADRWGRCLAADGKRRVFMLLSSAASSCGFFRNRFCWFLKPGQKSTRPCQRSLELTVRLNGVNL